LPFALVMPGTARRLGAPEAGTRSITPARPLPAFQLVDRIGVVLCTGTAFACQAAIVAHFGQGYWLGDEGVVLRAAEEGEPPIAVATIRAVPTLCAACGEPIEPESSGVPIVEEQLVGDEVVSETTSSGLYHPGECHTEALMLLVLDRAEKDAGEPGAN
jgi:hypothetical protein